MEKKKVVVALGHKALGTTLPEQMTAVKGAAKAVDLQLTEGEMRYLEEAYVPHKLVGVMAQNTPAAAKQTHVWSTGSQKIETK